MSPAHVAEDPFFLIVRQHVVVRVRHSDDDLVVSTRKVESEVRGCIPGINPDPLCAADRRIPGNHGAGRVIFHADFSKILAEAPRPNVIVEFKAVDQAVAVDDDAPAYGCDPNVECRDSCPSGGSQTR